MVVGHVEGLILRILLEALLAVPRGILQGKERTIRRQDVIQTTHANNGVVGVLNDALENLVLRRSERCVATVGVGVTKTKHIVGSALVPVDVGRIQSLLDVGSVEVDLSTGR